MPTTALRANRTVRGPRAPDTLRCVQDRDKWSLDPATKPLIGDRGEFVEQQIALVGFERRDIEVLYLKPWRSDKEADSGAFLVDDGTALEVVSAAAMSASDCKSGSRQPQLTSTFHSPAECFSA